MTNKFYYLIIILFLIIFLGINNDSMANWTHWLFSNKQYKEEIKIETYLMNKDQICGLFNKNIKKQYNYSKLSNKDTHLIVCLKNKGNRAAWGTLICVINGCTQVKVNIPHLGPKMQNFNNFVIPMRGIVLSISSNKNDFPIIVTKWDKLYTK